MPKATETTLEINLNSLEHNFEFLKSKLKANTLFLAVVKAFAYGSDAPVIAQCLQKTGVDYFAVAYIKEGIALRRAGIKTPILVLHPQEQNLDLAIEHCLEPSLYTLKILQTFERLAQQRNQNNYPRNTITTKKSELSFFDVRVIGYRYKTFFVIQINKHFYSVINFKLIRNVAVRK